MTDYDVLAYIATGVLVLLAVVIVATFLVWLWATAVRNPHRDHIDLPDTHPLHGPLGHIVKNGNLK